MEQMDLDVSVMHDLTLTEEEKRDLQLTSMLSGILFCQNCKRCLASCPQNVQIPTLMRSFMYAEGYGNLSQAQQTLEGLPGPQGLKTCRDCTTCSARCPNGIPIGTRIDSLSKVLA